MQASELFIQGNTAMGPGTESSHEPDREGEMHANKRGTRRASSTWVKKKDIFAMSRPTCNSAWDFSPSLVGGLGGC